MFKFEKEQKISDIFGVKIGGQPGQLPTVMFGSIFYHSHKIMKNEKTGDFDKIEAEKLLKNEEEISDKTGNPRIVDVCISWPQAFEKPISFVADTIDGPFSIDAVSAEIRIPITKYVRETGLSERIVYNSISPYTEEKEILAIKKAKIKSAILLTFNQRNPTILGRLQVMDKLLSLSQRAGIENILVDTAVLDMADSGVVSKVIYMVKEKYGLPAGAATHNAVERWRERCELNPTQKLLASSVANIFPIVIGANFVLYGPIKNALNAYFYCAQADAYVAYSMKYEFGIKPLTRNHPLFKIFRE